MMPDDLSPQPDPVSPEDPEAEHIQQVACETLAELLEKMKIKAQVSASWGEPSEPGEPRPLALEVTGDDLGILIGPRGETIAALQYVARLIISKELGKGINVVVDVEGHRRRREEQLRRMARKMAEQVVQRHRTMALEPMPAAERRIVHLELRDHPDVYTESVGEGEKRKVTIIPKKTSA
jgi:spoIIIJ-associated protein